MRRLPHVIDTVLLASALVMVVASGQYPFVVNWLTAKVLVLLVYIVLGWIALKSTRPPRVRVGAFVGAIAAFAYIVGVAITKSITVMA